MKTDSSARNRWFTTLALLFVMVFCGALFAAAQIPADCKTLIDSGEYTKAQSLLRQRAADPSLSESTKRALLFDAERLDRVRLDFTIPPDEMLASLKEDIPNVALADMVRWREEGVLEGRSIDGQLFFFNRAKRNLFRLSEEARARQVERPEEPRPYSDRAISIEDRMARIIEGSQKADERYVLPQRYRIKYTLTVEPDAVPAGQTVRCWLLYPRERVNQKDIRWLGSSPENARVASTLSLQRTAYLEQPAVAGKPTVFWIEYEVTTYAQYEPVNPEQVKPYDTQSTLYQHYTSERPPHLEFTPELRALAKEIVGNETNPYLKAKKIFGWIDENITYTSALEYSTIPNLSQYCALNSRGDCGIQGLLFIALCRISGVPAKWQSGWSLLPRRPGMHDWTEFYVVPYGWLPADPSRGLRPVDEPKIRWFNFGNMDQFRLIGNDDYSAELVPPKKHFRSEPVDFQRGEVEWDGGNLYFNQWDYEIEVKHL